MKYSAVGKHVLNELDAVVAVAASNRRAKQIANALGRYRQKVRGSKSAEKQQSTLRTVR